MYEVLDEEEVWCCREGDDGGVEEGEEVDEAHITVLPHGRFGIGVIDGVVPLPLWLIILLSGGGSLLDRGIENMMAVLHQITGQHDPLPPSLSLPLPILLRNQRNPH